MFRRFVIPILLLMAAEPASDAEYDRIVDLAMFERASREELEEAQWLYDAATEGTSFPAVDLRTARIIDADVAPAVMTNVQLLRSCGDSDDPAVRAEFKRRLKAESPGLFADMARILAARYVVRAATG